jgi:MSHA biogenesis protein MshP
MCPDSRQFRSRCLARAGGFAIMAAMFILVVLALLGAYVLSISSAHHVGSALDIEGSRALQAARSGLDWGISRAVNAPTSFGGSDCRTGTPSINLTTGASGDLTAISGFTVTVTCTGTVFSDGATSLYNYALMATACNQPSGGACPNTTAVGANYVERRLTVQVACNAILPC